jgi:radical SAM protein (TIGR01212 family)
MQDQIKNGIAYLKNRFKAKKFIVYFQAYTNTYDRVDRLEKLYREAIGYDDVIGIAVGTRSDCIDEEKIQMLEGLGKECFVSVEYGIESIYDKSLIFMNRGHNYQSVLDALRITKNRNIHVGAHIILGMPTETDVEMLQMATELSTLDIDSIKIHNLHIVRNTPLARIFQSAPFHLFTYDEYLDLIVNFLEHLSPSIVVERLFTDTPKDLLIAPIWNKSHDEVLRGIEEDLAKRNTYQGRLFNPTRESAQG